MRNCSEDFISSCPGVSSLDCRNGKVSFQIDGRIFARLKIGSGWQDIKDDMERMRRPNEDGKVEDPGYHYEASTFPVCCCYLLTWQSMVEDCRSSWSVGSWKFLRQVYVCIFKHIGVDTFFAPTTRLWLIQYLKHVWSIFHHPGYSYHVPPFSCPTPLPYGATRSRSGTVSDDQLNSTCSLSIQNDVTSTRLYSET